MSQLIRRAAMTLATMAICSLAGCWADFPESRFRVDVDKAPLDAAGADLVVDQRSDTAAQDSATDAAQTDTSQLDAFQPDAFQPDAFQPDTTVSLPLGSQCTLPSQCASGYCECMENSPACKVMVCCAIECSPGERCQANGQSCQ